ncbi:MAG: FecCD family ABC transporter permease [Acidimicrobiales bacterium]
MTAAAAPVTPAPAIIRRGGMYVVLVDRLGISARIHGRAVAVTATLLAAAAAAFAWSLSVGDFPIAITDVVATLFGRGSDEHEFIVRELRLPRGLTAVAVGSAFGMSGAIFQRLAGNPLASPDILGVNSGAGVAAVFVIVVVHGSRNGVTVAALLGATASALCTYLLAYSRGITGYRLVLVGIGVHAVQLAAIHYLMTRAEIYDAQRALVWITGSLNGRGWDDARPIGVALAVVIPSALVVARQLRILELGDDAARGLGGRVERSRAALLLCGVALAAVATASAGPIGFVALVAPQIARRLVGGRSLGLLPAAAGGALLVVCADLAGRRMFAPTELPVGVVTAVIGAPYLLYLLARTTRRGLGE